MSTTLTGYEFSVYTRSVRLALAVKGADHAYVECDPFDACDAARLRAVHPFGRVPVFDDGDFRIYETAATREHAADLPGPSLVPDMSRARVRMRQVMSIMDSYVYQPVISGFVSDALFRPAVGEPVDRDRLDQGRRALPIVLRALDEIAGEGHCLDARNLTLADCHLLPMLDYVQRVPEGADLIAEHRHLDHWLNWMQARPEVRETRPDLLALTRKEGA